MLLPRTLVDQGELEIYWKEALKFQIVQDKSEWMWMIGQTINRWSTKKNILEIGSQHGGSTCFLANFAKYLVTVDKWNPALYNTNDIRCDKFEYIAGNSHDPEIVKKLCCTQWDFVFIDGDHSYDGVKADFYNILPTLRDGVPVAFHDIIISEQQHTWGNYSGEFWNDLKSNHKYKKLKECKLGGWSGIGILWTS